MVRNCDGVVVIVVEGFFVCFCFGVICVVVVIVVCNDDRRDYSLVVRAADGGTLSLSSTALVSITVNVSCCGSGCDQSCCDGVVVIVVVVISVTVDVSCCGSCFEESCCDGVVVVVVFLIVVIVLWYYLCCCRHRLMQRCLT